MSLRRVPATLAVVVLVASCTSPQPQPVQPPEPQPTTASPTPDPKALEKFTEQKLAWGACESFKDKAFDCAKLTVPLDYLKPDGETISIGVLRHKAKKADQRIGSLVVNPGGPGGSGVSAAARIAKSLPAATLAGRFDIVGFDPRGVGTSDPTLVCLTDAERDADRAEDSESDTTPSGITKQLAEARAYAAKCAERTKHGKELLANIGTRDVVRDLDVLRSVLGDEKLTYLGFSYGTQIGTAYAEAYPDKVRALLLDGAVDPQLDTAESLVTQMAGFQNTFTEFGQWCVARADCALGRDAGAVTKAFQNLVQPLIAKPVPAGNRELSFEDAITGTSAALYSQDAWKFLNDGFAELKRGSGKALVALADNYYGRESDGRYTGILDVYFAVRCVDSTRITDRRVIDGAHERMLRGAPFLAGGTPDMSELDICSVWPVPATSEVHKPDIEGLPSPLVISTTDDPATPYASGVNLARDLKGALLTFEGAQHTVFLDGNACVDGAGFAYLIDGKLPAPDTRCT
ncbi:alpha/beta hydrolase [Amycolatopsis sp. BJA-103]|uniref:alpha/beta hydrolase n=1 Tax=Amycolatopsis sp. BJA-103 TaxID=1911175 RepID=UPI000C765619|nr:alpha/beta hydrolase [Amycolatopsis sp. BJA-103]AUI63758.1 alpha/beta hydrolase [Amycolatopsis sp. BJA-103]PNE19603.1 alpha/beta hydrolase [Amycolatopsis sp. BJA-103]